jgi:hypothetical protein
MHIRIVAALALAGIFVRPVTAQERWRGWMKDQVHGSRATIVFPVTTEEGPNKVRGHATGLRRYKLGPRGTFEGITIRHDFSLDLEVVTIALSLAGYGCELTKQLPTGTTLPLPIGTRLHGSFHCETAYSGRFRLRRVR